MQFFERLSRASRGATAQLALETAPTTCTGVDLNSSCRYSL